MPKAVHPHSPNEPELELGPPPEGGEVADTGAFDARNSGIYTVGRCALRIRQWPAMAAAMDERSVRCVVEILQLFIPYELDAERRWIKEKLLDMLERGEHIDEELLDAARLLFEPGH